MARQTEYIEHLKKVPLFSACTKKELALVARNSEHIDFQPGTVLTKEGQLGYEFFMIVDGKAKVERGGKQVAVLGPGDFFGELSMLDRAPRNATVTAITPMEVVLLPQREFSGLLDVVPGLAHKLLVGLARRIHEMDAKKVN